jgi:hypothetical protein
MKKIFSALCSVILIISACESDHNYPVKIPDGIYTGTFQRQLAFGGGDTSHVSITFSSNTWAGQSDRIHYPALCHGTYTIDKQKIIFTNECPWTAEFDGSLILGGEYNFTLNGTQLDFTRDYHNPTNDTYIDVYKLTKQE